MVDVLWKQHLDDIRLDSLVCMFGVQKPVIGMVHLWPLPGAPGYSGYGIGTILDHARQKQKITNNDVEKLTGVKHWQAANYLKILTKQRKLIKFGKTTNTFYKPVKY